jgi:Endonuclease/Exonuclease/phosphatase family
VSRCLAAALIAASCLAVAATPAAAKPRTDARFATFNASLNRGAAGDLIADLSNPGADTVRLRQARNVAEVIQRVAPDVVLINEFDFYENGQAARLFRDNFLAVSQNGAPAANYPYFFVAPSNTGIPSGFDLDNNLDTDPNDRGNDAFGFGLFDGQFGMVVYSKFPIDHAKARTFQKFLWKDMPGARLPNDPNVPGPADWYSPAELNVFRLSSKSHWDIPIRIGRKTVHFLTSHPTPPVFDGPEDRNGTRNADEIRFFADYVTPGRGRYIYDDKGKRGGLDRNALFVIAGDQNSDPLDGDSIPGAIQQLLDNPRIDDGNAPSSSGAVEATLLQGNENDTHRSDPQFDTADFNDFTPPNAPRAPGNLRADYVLPSEKIRIRDSAVFWPLQRSPLFRLTGVFDNATWGGPNGVGGFPTSDHRLVWSDLDLPGGDSDSDSDSDD